MKVEAIKQFMSALGIHNVVEGPTWVTGPCPLAPFLHKKGTDNKPSFGINVETGGFNCFTCQQGTLAGLLQTLELYVSQRPEFEAVYHFKAAREVLEGAANVYEPLPDYEAQAKKDPPFEPWPEWYLDQFIPWYDHPRSLWYLTQGRTEQGKGQSIDPAIATKLEMRYDAFHDRLVCPYRNFAGKLAGARGRAISLDAEYGHYDYSYNKINNANSTWYNEQALELACEDHKPILVVEGQFDCANVLRVYPYTVAGLTAKSSVNKIRKLLACDAVVTMLDNDKAGIAARDRYVQILGGKVRLGSLTFPEQFKDPACLTVDVMKELFKDLLE
jgi:hypothetical protein